MMMMMGKNLRFLVANLFISFHSSAAEPGERKNNHRDVLSNLLGRSTIDQLQKFNVFKTTMAFGSRHNSVFNFALQHIKHQKKVKAR